MCGMIFSVSKSLRVGMVYLGVSNFDSCVIWLRVGVGKGFGQ